jgi:hypothetical protein
MAVNAAKRADIKIESGSKASDGIFGARVYKSLPIKIK